MFFSSPVSKLVLALFACAGFAVAQDVSREAELELAVKQLEKKVAILQQQLLAAEERQSTPLDQALAEANQDAEKYLELYKELRLMVEGLGLEALGDDKKRQERALELLSKVNQLTSEKQRAEQQLLKLSEAIMQYLKENTPEGRAQIEVELRVTDEVLGFANAKPKQDMDVPLREARVISYKDDLNLAVLNIGRGSGVNVGMPLSIIRKDRVVGSALVVDVRDSICGAVVKEIFTQGDRIQVQDRAEPKTTTGTNL